MDTKKNFSDFPIEMQLIILCESEGNHLDKDGTVLKSPTEDIGIAQINKKFHYKTALRMGLDIYNVMDNLTYAHWLWQKEGTAPWVCAKKLGFYYSRIKSKKEYAQRKLQMLSLFP